MKKNGCIYCNPTVFWELHPIIEKERVTSTMHGIYPSSNPILHEGLTAKIRDHGYNVHNIDEDDLGYVNHVIKNPGVLEVRSEFIGKKLFPSLTNYPLIIDVVINYCPICGRKLGINSTDR